MIEVLRNKNLTTKFQILAEIADNGPDIQQREIAAKLDITPQAVSDYISQLIRDNFLVSEGRSTYKVTNEGINWVIKELKDLNSYSISIQRAVNNISVCAAIAEEDLVKGQKVGLRMKDGLLFASGAVLNGATGITCSGASAGGDIGITEITGIVALETGKVVILKIPGIERGGSAKINFDMLNKHVRGRQIVGSVGLEAYAALSRIDIDFYQFGAVEAAIESAKCGLNPVVVCVETEIAGLVTRLEQERIFYELLDGSKR
jgi:putative transcriptional regulator